MAKQTAEPRPFDLGTVGSALLALVFGFTAWMVVKQRDSIQLVMRVPVRATGAGDTVEVRLEQTALPVLFAYPKSAEMFMRDGSFWIEIDLEAPARRLRPGEDIIQKESLSMNDVKRDRDVPPTIVPVVFTEESRVDWSIRLRTAELRVAPDLRGEAREGFEIDRSRVFIEPETVTVAITAELEARLAAGAPPPVLTTEPVDVSGATEITARDARIIYPESEGVRPLPVEATRSVLVNVPVTEVVLERSIPGVPVAYEPLLINRRAEVEPSRITVTVRGPRSIVERLTPADFIVSPRDVRDELEGPQEVELVVNIPESKRLGKPVTVTPATTRVLVRVSRTGDASPRPGPAAGDPLTTPTATRVDEP